MLKQQEVTRRFNSHKKNRLLGETDGSKFKRLNPINLRHDKDRKIIERLKLKTMLNQVSEVNNKQFENLITRLGFTNFDFQVDGDDLNLEMTLSNDTDFRIEKSFNFSGESKNLLEDWHYWEIENAITDSIYKLIELYKDGKIQPKPN